MLGQPLSMLIPQVVGFRLHGKLREGSTATDLVLTVTEMLRKTGVVGKFVEFFGAGRRGAVARRPRDHRQHGARVRRHLRHLPDRRRDAALPALHGAVGRRQIELVEAYAREQGMFHGRGPRPRPSTPSVVRPGSRPAVEPSVAGPKRPQDRVSLFQTRQVVRATRCPAWPSRRRRRPPAGRVLDGDDQHRLRARVAGRRPSVKNGSVVIAAITSCTNTSNPSVLVAAGLLAKKAVETGLHDQAVGEDVAGARARRWSPSTWPRRG